MISPPRRNLASTKRGRAIEMMIAEREQRLRDLTQPT
jgi:hypothetical protein